MSPRRHFPIGTSGPGDAHGIDTSGAGSVDGGEWIEAQPAANDTLAPGSPYRKIPLLREVDALVAVAPHGWRGT